ncbi:hypothetical protein C8E97_2155 [Saccharothrix australiensis]|uniref:Uncharacterized protein n=1 Tax=Saccharothrix australiensis TaxID=2072 RepID=A0A495VYU5_9PSEU|nr:hypothetical protein C8E97_2155 [Saccharothrix australiensis]
MTGMVSGVEHAEDAMPETALEGLDERLVDRLVSRARAGRAEVDR